MTKIWNLKRMYEYLNWCWTFSLGTFVLSLLGLVAICQILMKSPKTFLEKKIINKHPIEIVCNLLEADRKFVNLCRARHFLGIEIWQYSLWCIRRRNMSLQLFCHLIDWMHKMHTCNFHGPKCMSKGKLLMRKDWRFNRWNFLAFWWNFLKNIPNDA